MRFLFLFLFTNTLNANAQHWNLTQLQTLPIKTSNNAVCEGFVGDTAFVYSFAGIDSSKIYAGIHLNSFRLNLTTSQWQTIPSLPDTMGKIACAASRIKDTIYIIGGYHVLANTNEISSNKVHRYNIITNQFMNDGSNSILPIDDQVQCVYKDSLIYIVTGWSNTANVANVQVYNPKLNNWQTATAMPNNNTYKSFGASGTIIGDTLYFLGGASSGAGFTAQTVLRKGYIDPANPLQITWSFINPNVKAYRSACTSIGNNIYWLGGSEITYNYNGIAYNGSGGVSPSNKSRRLTSIWDFDITNNLPMDLRGVAKINDSTIIIVGGMNSNQLVTNQVLKLKNISSASTAMYERKNNFELNVFPNPVTDRLYLHIDKNAIVTILNAQSTVLSIHKNTKSVDMSMWQAGVYFIKVEHQNSIMIKKIIKIDD